MIFPGILAPYRYYKTIKTYKYIRTVLAMYNMNLNGQIC